MFVTPLETPPKKPFPYWILAIPGGAFALLFGAFLAIWQFLTPAERVMPVPYSDFIVEVHQGKVEEIRIRDREIRYRLRANGSPRTLRETTGPVPDQAMLDTLKPDDPTAPAPKIVFEPK